MITELKYFIMREITIVLIFMKICISGYSQFINVVLDIPQRSELRMTEISSLDDTLNIQWLEIVVSENINIFVEIVSNEDWQNPPQGFYLNDGSMNPDNAIPFNASRAIFPVSNSGRLMRNFPDNPPVLTAFLGLSFYNSFSLNIVYQ